jgi:MFS family permease
LERASGGGTIVSTLLSGIPFLFALVGLWVMGRSSDARNERRWHAAGPLLICAAVFPLTLLPNQPFSLYFLWSCIVGLALWAWAPAFWSLPTLLMGESAAAVSLGLINCIGNLGGFFGPWLTGWLVGQGSGWAEGVSAIAFGVAALIILSADLRSRVDILHDQTRLSAVKEAP